MFSTSLIYNEISTVNTYACKKAIKSSKNMIAVTMTHGQIANKTITVPDVISVQENPIRIFSNACPDSILAKSRILKLNTRAMYETASIKIRKGAIASGAPAGKKRSIVFQPCFTTATWLSAKK